jgi:hypothetical protein
MNQEEELKVLKAEYDLLAEQLSENNKKQNAIKRDLLLQKYFKDKGISIGDDVIVNTERAKVESADSNYLYVRKYKKGGGFYLGTTKVWSFDKINKLTNETL